MTKLRNNRKGQGFTIDYIVGLIIFIFLVVVAAKLFIDIIPDTGYETTYKNNIFLADTLLDNGYPDNWNSSTVILPGIADNQVRINSTLLSRFQNLSYSRTKTLFHIESEYMFFFQNSSGILNLSSCVYGYPAPVDENCTFTLDADTYDHLTKIKRLVIVDGRVAEMYVYVWRR